MLLKMFRVVWAQLPQFMQFHDVQHLEDERFKIAMYVATDDD